MISERAADIFLEARELDPDARAGFVADACGGDDELRAEVESLLAASDESESYFERLAGRVGLEALADEGDAPEPGDKVIGSWRLTQRIGRGGMGAVYLAERADEQFEQRAALKILPLGLDSEQARARFLVERQILARLVHDNIARLLDGGVTDDGLPYFVMDYVDGLPIDEYCDAQQLGIENRLSLVLDVARAVQFAHRNLIIHRDLKPSNVLVDEGGNVRLLDFGIAKMLGPDAADPKLTRQAQRPATPAFASPEMLRGEPVDVTADVYSIGALLYVLLTGRLPLDYDGLTLVEIHEHAANAIPAPVSRLNAAVNGELDAIVARALAKLPEERYASVESLANDLRNYLDGLPVEARAPSAFYRAGKFVRRHRLGTAFAAFAVIALATIAGLAVTSAVVSDRQARQIALERDRAEQTKEFLISIFDSADPNVVPGEQTAREILDVSRQRIGDELAGQPAVQADLLEAMSDVYQSWRLAGEGSEVLEQELELRRRVNGEDSVEYADVLLRLALNADIGGDYDASLAHAQDALDIGRRLPDAVTQGRGHERIGRVLHLKGDLDGAGSHYELALELLDGAAGSDPLEIALLHEHLGNLLIHRQQFEPALEEFGKSLEIRNNYQSGDSSQISPVYLGMASALRRLGRLDEAADAYRAGYDMNERLYGPGNSYNLYFANGLGKVAEARGDLEDAESRYREATALILRHTPESPNLAFAEANVAKTLALRGQCERAIPHYRTAAEIFERHLPEHWALGDVQWRLGRCLVETGDYGEAGALIRTGLATVADHWGDEHEFTAQAREAAALLDAVRERADIAQTYSE